MPTVKNVKNWPADLDDGTILQPGQTKNVDVNWKRVAELIANGELTVLDSIQAPALPVTPAITRPDIAALKLAGILGSEMIPVATNSQLNPGPTYITSGGTSSRIKYVCMEDVADLRLVLSNILNIGTVVPAEQFNPNPIKVRASIEVGNGKIAKHRYFGTVAAYNAGTTYVVGSRVSSGGIYYVSLQAGNLGNTPASSPTFWAVMNEKDEWNAATTYNPGDFVFLTSGPAFYICIAANTNQLPPNATYWTTVSSVSFAYDANIAYRLNDQVVSGGAEWVCIQAGTGQAPAVGSAYWRMVDIYPVEWPGIDGQRDIWVEGGKTIVSDPVGIQPGLKKGDIFYVRMTCQPQGRTDTATVTNASATVADVSITAADQGRRVTGVGIPESTYVGTVTPATSFLLSSSSVVQVNVNATANGTAVTIMGAPNQGGWPRCLTIARAAGDTEHHAAVGAAPEDCTLVFPNTGRVPNADATTTFSSIAVLGRPKVGISTRKVIAVVGDSVANGTGDDVLTWGDEALGYILRSLMDNPAAPTVPTYTYLRMARGSALGQDQYGVGVETMMTLAEGCTHVIDQWGVNDIGGGRTLAQIQADALQRWAAWDALGLVVIACTITPKTTSTDNWATTVNQTPAASFGASSKWSQYNDWVRTKPAPLSAVIDAAAAVTAGGAAGTVWTPGMVWLTDGLGIHPSAAGHIAIAQSINVAALLGTP